MGGVGEGMGTLLVREAADMWTIPAGELGRTGHSMGVIRLRKKFLPSATSGGMWCPVRHQCPSEVGDWGRLDWLGS